MSNAQPLVTGPTQELIKRGIGASMAATCIGMNPYQAPIDAWLVLTGRQPHFAGNEATRWGTILEPVIRAHYVERNNVAVYVPPTSLFHPELPWLRATPDGIVVDDDGVWQYVAPQVKSVGLRMAPRWDDGPPEEYVIQAVVEMAVTALPRLDFAVLIGAQHYQQPTVHRDLELESIVLQQLSDFWRLVELDQQPPIDGSDTFRKFLAGQIKRRHVIDASPMDAVTIARWRDVAIEMARLKATEKQLKNTILGALAEADANVMSSELGDIKVGKPKKKTKWKDVAERLRPLLSTLPKIDRELITLRFDAAANLPETDANVLAERIDALRAQVRVVMTINNFDDLVESFTTLGAPPVNRPRDWTADLDDDTEQES